MNPLDAWSNLGQATSAVKNIANNFDALVGGQREVVRPNNYNQNPQNPQNYNPNQGGQNSEIYNVVQEVLQNMAGQQRPNNQYNRGYQDNHQTPIYQPRAEYSEELLRIHAQQRVQMMGHRIKMKTIVPKEILIAYFDRKKDRAMIDVATRNNTDWDKVELESDLGKALERQERVAQLREMKGAKEIDKEMESLIEMSMEEFRIAQEEGRLKLPTVEEYEKDIIKGTLFEFSEFIIYGLKEVTGSYSGQLMDSLEGFKDKILG